MKRFRIRTLMLSVLIAALVTAVLMQQIQINRYKAQLQASLAETRAMQVRTLQLLAVREESLLLESQKRAELEIELYQTKRILNSAKAETAKTKQGSKKK
jgi:hypothetical protein